MKGHKFLKVTGILMIIASAFQIIAGVLVGGLGSKGCIGWGIVVAVFAVLAIVMTLVNGGSFDILSVITGLVVPVLYIYGAVLNTKADDAQPAA